jgi:hypothetical protein
MHLRVILSSLAIVAAPIAVGAEQPRSRSPDYATKKICDTNVPLGSRLGGVRRCRTRAEIDEARAESRRVVDRVQSMKVVVCGPGSAIPAC